MTTTKQEVELIQRTLKYRPDVQEVLRKIIHEEANEYWEMTSMNPADDLPDIIINRFINAIID